MPTITIDGKNYELDSFSTEARNQLASLQFVDAELQRVAALSAVLQTARMAYSKSLQDGLRVLDNRGQRTALQAAGAEDVRSSAAQSFGFGKGPGSFFPSN